ncbi:MAG: hypothetical protein ACYC2P_06590 [Paludibacteraceae bacterium]
MTTNDDKKEQERRIQEMDYPSDEDIFKKESHLLLNEDGEMYKEVEDDMDMDIDVPGSGQDNEMEEIGSEDEENNYWSLGSEDNENLEQSEDL